MGKQKTHKGRAKRFKKTGRGSVVHRRSGKNHYRSKKTSARKRRLDKMGQVYGKVKKYILIAL